jgi:hypothetical protein
MFDVHFLVCPSYEIAKTKVSFLIRLAVFLASGGACMKLHEIQCHFYEVPHAISEYRLRRHPRPPSPKNSYFEDEHDDEYEYEKNKIKIACIRLAFFLIFRIPNSEFKRLCSPTSALCSPASAL